MLFLPAFGDLQPNEPGNSEFALRRFWGVSGFVPDFAPEMLNCTRCTSELRRSVEIS